MEPGEIFKKLLEENNLKVYLGDITTKKIDDGSIIIAPPLLYVDWINKPDKEVVPKEESNV